MAVSSNWCRCTSCHVGYGWKDNNFDFTSERNVDCLACHDTTGTYSKFPTACGRPPLKDKKFGTKLFKAVDLKLVATKVGSSSRRNCGMCHFFGGGGDGVKHGDLDSSLFSPSRDLDVHMDAKGLNYQCSKCHTTRAHDIAGRYYTQKAKGERRLAMPKDDPDRIYCESCHSSMPHKGYQKLNDHTDKVSCQACHIPAFAREKPTKMWWDWSKAGKFAADGKILVKKDADGNMIYHTKKGEMRWARSVTPEYYWYNGTMIYVTLKDRLDDSGPVDINHPLGDYSDPDSRIYPFKVHRGKQPYDPVNKTLIVPKLFGKKGSGAFWGEYDWVSSARAGMASVGVPFSGKVGFIQTATYWPITHMVAPKEKALKCNECHSRNGRLSNLSGFYLPGRDINRLLDTSGWVMVGLAIAGVLVHASLRITASLKKGV